MIDAAHQAKPALTALIAGHNSLEADGPIATIAPDLVRAQHGFTSENSPTKDTLLEEPVPTQRPDPNPIALLPIHHFGPR